MPVLLNAPNNPILKMSRLSSYPLGALRLSRFAMELGCVGVLTFRGGRPFLIGSGSRLAPTNTPLAVVTEEGVAYDLTAASSQTASATIAPRNPGTDRISVIARLKPRVLPASAAAAIEYGNTANNRGLGVGFDSSGHALALAVGSVSTQTIAGTNVFSSFVTIGCSASTTITGAAVLYENGVKIGTSATPGAAGGAFTSVLKLGQDFAGTLGLFDGQIAWAAIFNTILSDAHHAVIAAHPERLLALKYPALTGSVIAAAAATKIMRLTCLGVG